MSDVDVPNLKLETEKIEDLENDKIDLTQIISIGESNNSNGESDNDIKSENNEDQEEAPLKIGRRSLKRQKRKRRENSNCSEGFSCDICDFVASNAASLGDYYFSHFDTGLFTRQPHDSHKTATRQPQYSHKTATRQPQDSHMTAT